MASFSPSDIQALMSLFDESDWVEMHLQTGDLELFLSRNPNASLPGAARPLEAPGAVAPSVVAPLAAPVAAPVAAPESGAGGASTVEAIPDGMVALRAPNLGTFYSAPKPGAPAYIEIGQQVEPDTEVCLIEVMKLFTPVRAGMKGILRQVCVDDAQLVEFDQPLFFIEPL